MAALINEIDSVIIKYADTLSPAQIAFKIASTGGPVLTAEYVLTRIGKLTETPDWLSAAQEDVLITLKMKVLTQELGELPLSARNAEVIFKGLELIGSRLEKRLAATESDLNKHYAFEGVALLEMVEKALTHMKTLVTGADKISPDAWDVALIAGLRFAELEMQRQEEEQSTPAADTITVKAIEKSKPGSAKTAARVNSAG